jgi:hypothetical protein
MVPVSTSRTYIAVSRHTYHGNAFGFGPSDIVHAAEAQADRVIGYYSICGVTDLTYFGTDFEDDGPVVVPPPHRWDRAQEFTVRRCKRCEKLSLS